LRFLNKTATSHTDELAGLEVGVLVMDVSIKAINLRVTGTENLKCDTSDMDLLAQDTLCLHLNKWIYHMLMGLTFTKFITIRNCQHIKQVNPKLEPNLKFGNILTTPVFIYCIACLTKDCHFVGGR
jgi:hypothetical protein